MEIRSIQRFGSGTHVISLPKKWTEKYKIEKGDKIVIIEKEHGILVLYPEKLKKLRQVITLEDSPLLRREILSSYLSGYDIIRIKNVKNKKIIRETAQTLIGLEILKETTTDLELHFLIESVERQDPREYITNCLNIALTMQKDGIKSFFTSDKTLAKEVIERDHEVNRLYFLVVRLLKTFLRHPELQHPIVPEECLDWRLLGSYAEELGDLAVEICNMTLKHKMSVDMLFSHDLQKKFIRLMEETHKNILSCFKAFLSRDVHTADSLKTKILELWESKDALFASAEINGDITNYQMVYQLTRFLTRNLEIAVDIADLVIR